MAIRDVVKVISKTHDYKVTGGYWARVGSICKRYGEDTVNEAINTVQPNAIPLTMMLNILEKKCQWILENGKGSIDDLVNDILNSGDEE